MWSIWIYLDLPGQTRASTLLVGTKPALFGIIGLHGGGKEPTVTNSGDFVAPK